VVLRLPADADRVFAQFRQAAVASVGVHHGAEVVVSDGELREAAESGHSYWLIGIIDDGRQPSLWKTVLLRNPLAFLLREGEFSANPELRVTAEALIRAGRR
jgi:hypothetical protein